MNPKIRARVAHPLFVAYTGLLIFAFGTWAGALTERAEIEALGALPSPPVPDLGNSELFSGFVTDTPTDEAYRGNHRMVVETLSPEQIDEACDGGPEVFACANEYYNRVYVPNPCLYPREAYASVMCHEQAHLKGWDHEPNNPGWHYWYEEEQSAHDRIVEHINEEARGE